MRDLTGQALIALRNVSGGTEAHLVSQLVASSQPLSMVARAMPRLAHRAHDWLLDAAACHFSLAAGLSRRLG